ncbi:hypothetical protein NQ317_001509 [Molorchus minor]|uniref:SCP2 domain-containing protein n=1 Tax=Molorchus minor TaxID=1323400 RepID=A0ABQ9JVI4_9CUCU|nr:hypothetical protein NQ317_001509 [Molorchus minor]
MRGKLKQEEPKDEVAKLFKAIESSLSQDTVAKTQAVFEFNAHRFKKWQRFLWARGSCLSLQDATLTMDSKNFFNMFSGKLKPATAYMTGKLKISEFTKSS